MENVKKHIDEIEGSLSLKILALKELRERLAEAENESIEIEEQLRKSTRTGRQPHPGGGRSRGNICTNGTKKGTHKGAVGVPEEPDYYSDNDGENENTCGGMVIPYDDDEEDFDGLRHSVRTEGSRRK